MEKLTIKHLAPYLPYGLKIEFSRNIYPKKTEIQELSIFDFHLWDDNKFKIKPILRPLSDLRNEININGNGFIPFKKLETKVIMSEFDLNEWIETITESMPLSDWNLLFEWHFDVFGLIEKGLAIDINTLNK